MHTRTIPALLAATTLLLALGGVGFGDEEPAKPMSEAEMWAKVMELAQPGPMHEKVLSRLVGTWKAQGKMFSGMGEIPVSGTSVHEWILGKRFVQVSYEGPMMGGTFEGRAFIGYDNMQKTFQQVWIMTMGSGMDLMTGSWDAETQTLTWTYEMKTPDGQVWKKRDVTTFEGPDTMLMEAYAAGADGKEHKEMELRYTRVKDDDAK